MSNIIGSLVGEVLTHIDISKEFNQDRIMLTTASGRVVLIHHDQDCCEVVRIVGTDGDWLSLVGKVIEYASVVEVDERGRNRGGDGQTKTDITFRVDDATVISRWIGESNGYYSESVDFCELAKAEA